MALFHLANLAKDIDKVKDNLVAQMTTAYFTLRAAKDWSYDCFADDPQAYWVPQLMYERARGQLDALHDVAITLFGSADARTMLSTAAKAANYSPIKENEWSVHAANALAKHTPSAPSYSYGSSSRTSRGSSSASKGTQTSLVTVSGSKLIPGKGSESDAHTLDTTSLPYNCSISDLTTNAPWYGSTAADIRALVAKAVKGSLPDSLEAAAELWSTFCFDEAVVRYINKQRQLEGQRMFTQEDLFEMAPPNITHIG